MGRFGRDTERQAGRQTQIITGRVKRDSQAVGQNYRGWNWERERKKTKQKQTGR